MGRDEPRLSAAKKSYNSAKEEGNRQEEARWANVIGDILKNRGEYVEALKWLRIDYDVSVKYLTERHLLPTCQSLGEVYLRLEYFKDALLYQKKHLELAKDSGDLVEQQRASTQLGRTYYEMLLRSEDDHYSVRNAKKYFKSAMKLAQTLKENPPPNNSSFLREYIDAHNNIGMLEIELDNLEEARKILSRGLDICDEEEVMENDDGRSRLHHNLGNVYMELRMWEKAREHIEKDIIICKRIGHCQGEAKGYINLGELHNRVHKYGDALLCYQKAIDLAKSMEDEDALVRQIDENIEIVKSFINIMDELKREEQNLKKLVRGMATAKGTPTERKCLLKQNTCLDCLIDKSRTISAWLKLRDYSKRKKKVTAELHDKEKLSDSFLVIGESYQKLRKFVKAIKWYQKSWETYKSIGNLEGQALAKINIGNVLDSDGDWQGALDAFEESYRISVEANVPHVQLSALENMHYSHMIRFDHVEEARRLQLLIDRLKQSENRELQPQNVADCCSETDTEVDHHFSNKKSRESYSPETSRSTCDRSEPLPGEVELDDDTTLLSLIQPAKRSAKMKTACIGREKNFAKLNEVSPKSLSKTISNQQTVVGRKRVRVVISDDEEEMNDYSKGAASDYPMEDVATSSEFRNKSIATSPVFTTQDTSAVATKCAFKSYSPVNIEESSSSYKNASPYATTPCDQPFKSSSTDEVAIASGIATSNSKCETDRSENRLHDQNVSHLKLHPSGHEHDKYVTFKIGNELIHIEADSFVANDKLNIDSVKVELACLYYLQLPMEKRSEGLFPIIQHIKCCEKIIDSPQTIEAFTDNAGEVSIEAVIDGWVQKRLIKLYIECCKKASASPNMKLLKKLYYLGVSDDEVIVSGCELQDLSITPLLNALHIHKTFAILDISHNLLGNGTMEKLQQVFTSSGQNYGGLTLDLHCNRFGPTALFQICECPMLFARLEVLNISGNRLTDACASYLFTILKSFHALCSLNIERCSITSRTIQKVADALNAESSLEQLSIGHNSPISGNAIISLLAKLATLKRFSKLNLNGLKLSKPVVDSLCHLAKGSCLSTLMLGETGIRTDGALQIAESLLSESEDGVRLDLSYSGLTPKFTNKLTDDVSLFCCILELNLSGNPLMQEGSIAISSFLKSSLCCLKVLFLNKCQLGVAGILQVAHALAGDVSLEELFLADNADLSKHYTKHDISIKDCKDILQSESLPKLCLTVADLTAHGICHVNTDCNQLEVPDSEDDSIRDEPAASGIDDICATYPKKNSPLECRWIQELSISITKAKRLRLLDLSNNGFSKQAAEMFYSAWSSSRVDSACRHIKDQIIHLSMQGTKCCVKPCCRKD